MLLPSPYTPQLGSPMTLPRSERKSDTSAFSREGSPNELPRQFRTVSGGGLQETPVPGPLHCLGTTPTSSDSTDRRGLLLSSVAYEWVTITQKGWQSIPTIFPTLVWSPTLSNNPVKVSNSSYSQSESVGATRLLYT